MEIKEYIKKVYAVALTKKTENLDGIWDIEELVRPKGPRNNHYSSPNKDVLRKFSDVAPRAADTLASAISGGYTNPRNKWFIIRPSDGAYEADSPFKNYADYVNRDILKVLSEAPSNFYTSNMINLNNWVSIGTFCVEVDDKNGKPVFKNIPSYEYMFLEGSDSSPRIYFREIQLHQYQVVQKYGKNFPKYHPDKPDQVVELLKFYTDKETYKAITGRQPPWSAEWGGYIIDKDTFEPLKVLSSHHRPFIVCRYELDEDQVWGSSPAWRTLPSIRQLNLIEKMLAETVVKYMRPAYFASDSATLNHTNIKPSAIITGALGTGGEELLKAQYPAIDLNSALALVRQYENNIHKGFFTDAFQEREGTPVSAAEYMSRARDKLRLTGSKTARLEKEYLQEVIEAVYLIRERAGVYRPVLPFDAEGAEFDIQYSSPLAQNQNQDELNSLTNMLGVVASAAQMDPSLLSSVFNRLDKAKLAEWLIYTSGVPSNLLKDESQVQADEAAAAQNQQEQELLSQAPQLIDAMKNLQSTAG